MANNPLLRAALYYAGRNWPVFPIWWVSKNGRCACGKASCAHPGKHPIGKLAPRGRNSATTDPKKIKLWWRQYPKANIGLPTGPESGLVVVDIDPRNGGDRQNLERLGPIPNTPTAKTGGGGVHILLKHPGRKVKSRDRLGGLEGIDQKGNGGYIVAPPSNHVSGSAYAWQIKPDTPLADIPEWLMGLLIQEGTPERPQAHQGGREPQAGGDYAAYAQRALADELAVLAGTPEGSRNDRLNQAAFALGQLVGAGALNRGQVEAALTAAAVGIGLTAPESAATIRSGVEAGTKSPRELPERAARGRRGTGPGERPGSPGEGAPEGPEGPEARFWLCGHCYFVDRGRLCLEKLGKGGEPAAVPLANFAARIVEEISRDDGLKAAKEFVITGSLDTGRPLPLALVTAKEYDSLKWVSREWGAAASVAPGRSLGPHLVNAIQAHSQGFERRTVFCHSGWRKIGGAWRYLHGGGAIGPGEAVEVDLGENLGSYRLPEPGGREAAAASLRFLRVADWQITAALLAAAYLAPFADLCRVNFSLWLYGPSGSFKSTLAALALSHFGNFDVRSLPATWLSTANALEKLTFTLKDALCVIDDFTPPTNGRESRAQMEKAARLIYQAGNRSARGRLAADLSLRPNYFPRGLIISTGELLLPGQRQSATARYLGIEFDEKKNPIDQARLTAAQGEAHLYAGAMAAFLADLAPRLDETVAELKDNWLAYRSAFRGGGHHRIPEIQAWLMAGFEVFLKYQRRQENLTADEAYDLEKQAFLVFQTLGEKHGRLIEGERPTAKFLAILSELFLTSRVYAEGREFQGTKPPQEALLGWQGSDPARNSFLVGYADADTLFLLAETTYRAVAESVRAQGGFLGLGKKEMLAALAREGLIEPGTDGKNVRKVWLQGGARWVICLPRKHLGHDEAMPEDEE
jgi:hypothetical protein